MNINSNNVNPNLMKMNVGRWSLQLGIWGNPLWQHRRHYRPTVRLTAALTTEKPPICTADELHYVAVPNTQWHLALWRYLPSPAAPTARNHPLLLLSGVGANAIGYDLSPQSSFARHMSGQGFDTWILEVRGAGLSKRLESVRGFSETTQTSTARSLVKDLGRWVSEFAKSPTTIPLPFPQFNEHLAPVLEEFLRQVDLFQNSDWDLDQMLNEDLPLVMDYIRTQSKPRDGKLLAIGHSMGGILLYAMLSLYGFEGCDHHLAAVTTLASSLDYSSSRSSLRLLLPVTDPAKALNVTAIPFGVVMAALYPFASRPPFLLYWLNAQISAQDMMTPELFERLVLKNFCTVPAKLLLQLATLFESTGLSDRSRTFFYKEHIHRTNVPILALAGDQDLICPPEAVYGSQGSIPMHHRVFECP
uniref:AB hydrolase-1 domain-containing protein n=1 Tax=Opuntia streptacantha TaxID=393608 RepID=A0A7C9EAG9_OPUST